MTLPNRTINILEMNKHKRKISLDMVATFHFKNCSYNTQPLWCILKTTTVIYVGIIAVLKIEFCRNVKTNLIVFQNMSNVLEDHILYCRIKLHMYVQLQLHKPP